MPEKHVLYICFFGLLVSLTLSPHLYAMPIELKVNDKICPADILKAKRMYLKGGLLITSDFGHSIYEPKLTKPLQIQLKNYYWSALSLGSSSNIEMNQECIAEGISSLQKNEAEPVFLIARGQSFKSAMKYFIDKRPVGVFGLILISPYPYNPKEDQELLNNWVKVRLPMLIIYNQRDYKSITNTVNAIEMAHITSGNELLRLRTIRAGNPGSVNYNEAAAKSIISWLYFVKRHIDFVAKEKNE